MDGVLQEISRSLRPCACPDLCVVRFCTLKVHANRPHWLQEQQLEKFVDSQGATLSGFLAACKAALQEGSGWEEHRGFVDSVLAMGEYEYFVGMMADAAEEATAEGEADEMVSGAF